MHGPGIIAFAYERDASCARFINRHRAVTGYPLALCYTRCGATVVPSYTVRRYYKDNRKPVSNRWWTSNA